MSKKFNWRFVLFVPVLAASLSSPSRGQSVWHQVTGQPDPIPVHIPTPGEVVQGAQDIATQQAQGSIRLVGAIATGNTQEIRNATGQIFLNSTSCFSCMQIARNVMPQMTDEQIHAIAGDGVLVFIAPATVGAAPSIIVTAVQVIGDVVYVNEHRVSPPVPIQQTAGALPLPPPPRTLTTKARCIGSSTDQASKGFTLASFDTPPVFVDPDGKSRTFPAVALRLNDVIEVTASSACPGFSIASAHTTSLKSARIHFSQLDTASNDDASKVTYYLSGGLITP